MMDARNAQDALDGARPGKCIMVISDMVGSHVEGWQEYYGYTYILL